MKMTYEPIGEYSLRDIQQVVFDKDAGLEDKINRIYSAIYYLDVEETANFLIKIFQLDDKELSLATADMLEAFMQSRSTNYGFKQFMEAINRLKRKYPQHSDALADIGETLFELNAIFS